MLDLRQCSASDLARHLRHERFSGDARKVTEFLQQAIQSIPASEHSGDDGKAASAAIATPTVEFGTPLLKTTPLETSLLTPRGGKCSIQLYENGYLVATSSLKATPSSPPQLVVPASAVSHVLLFAKPEEYKVLWKKNSSHSTTKTKPPNAHLVLLKLHESSGVTFHNKPVTQVCFALSWVKGIGPTGPDGPTGASGSTSSSNNDWKEATRAWRHVLETCLGGPHNNPSLVVALVADSSPEHDQDQGTALFVSAQSPDQSTTTGGMPFVKCYHGVQDGALFPLKEGLLFYKYVVGCHSVLLLSSSSSSFGGFSRSVCRWQFIVLFWFCVCVYVFAFRCRPPQFLPRGDLVSIACGRGGGGGQSSSRYVDMVVETQLAQNDETKTATTTTTTVEFTNIQREELAVLNEYIHHVLIPAMRLDAPTKKPAHDEGASSSDQTKEEEDDETEDEVDTDPEDENFSDGENDDSNDAHDQSDDESDSEEEEDDDDGFEVVDDEFATELAKHSTRHNNEPRASRSRSSKRKGTPAVQQPQQDDSDVAPVDNDGDDDAIIVPDDDDFEVVQAASSTESENDETSESPTKKRRH